MTEVAAAAGVPSGVQPRREVGAAPTGACTRAHVHSGEQGALQDTAQKIAGGYVQVPTVELVLAWSAYRAGVIRALDFRVWLASYEIEKRRAWGKRGRKPVFTAREIYGLVGGGGGERATRASLRRLAKLGLLTWKEGEGPCRAKKLNELTVDLTEEVQAMFDAMPARRRFFPLQRRMLRVLTGGVKRAVLASVLSHALRCIHRDTKTGSWSGAGACSASWVAETFGVGESSVRRARAHLKDELGWLSSLEAPQWFVNRYGGRFEVDLNWNSACTGNGQGNSSGNNQETVASVGLGAGISAPVEAQEQQPDESSAVENLVRAEFSTARMRGPFGENERRLRGPIENRPLPRRKIKKSDPSPERARPRDDSFSEDGGGGRKPNELPPKLTDVKSEDLRSVARVMELFDQALESRLWRSKGWTPVADTTPERLNWAAAAHRARVRGGENPAGLFIHLVTKRLFGHVTNEDEDAVRVRLSEWQAGVSEGSFTERSASYEDLGEEDGLVPMGYGLAF